MAGYSRRQAAQLVVVDGWKQAWLVPPATSGTVRMVFEPQGVFSVSIVLGLVLAACLGLAALVTLALWLRRRGPTLASTEPPEVYQPDLPDRVRQVGLVAGLAVLVVVSVPLAVGAVAGFFARRAGTVVVAAGCVVGVLAAALVAIWGDDAVVVPPTLSDVVVAVVVGSVCGAVLGRRAERGGGPS